MSCEYCDGESQPEIVGRPLMTKLLFCIRGRTLIMRAMSKNWLYPQWLLSVNYCPMCGRNLRKEGGK